MKVKIELEVPDNFEPCTTRCEDTCPFGFYDDVIGDNSCDFYDDNCPMEDMEEINGTN